MNSRDARRVRPGQETDSQKIAATTSTHTLQPTTLTHPKAVAPAFVVFTFTDDGELMRRNVYVSLHSALKAKERAEARGARFELVLCELVPVPQSPVIVVGGGDR